MTEPNADGTSKTAEQLQAELDKQQAELDKTALALKAANAESAERRIKLKELEAERDSKLSAEEKLNNRIAELEKKNAAHEAAEKRRQISLAIQAKAKELGFDNPEDAEALIDTSKVEITDDGKITGFGAELDALAKSGRLPMKGDQPQQRRGGTLRPAYQQHPVTGKQPEVKEPPVNPSLTHI